MSHKHALGRRRKVTARERITGGLSMTNRNANIGGAREPDLIDPRGTKEKDVYHPPEIHSGMTHVTDDGARATGISRTAAAAILGAPIATVNDGGKLKQAHFDTNVPTHPSMKDQNADTRNGPKVLAEGKAATGK